MHQRANGAATCHAPAMPDTLAADDAGNEGGSVIRLALLLFGVEFVRRRWPWLALLGATWTVAGAAIFIDALDGVLYFPLRVFAALMICEGGIALVGAYLGIDRDRRNLLRVAKGAVFVAIGVLVLTPYRHAYFALAVLFALYFLVSGVLRIVAARAVRFHGWQASLALGMVEVAIAVFLIEPWPTYYKGTLPYCIGIGLAFTGWSLWRLALNLRRLPRQAALSTLTGRGGPRNAQPVIWEPGATERQPHDLIVHVWTPLGSAVNATRRPIVDRYIAAVDGKGVISTGHAALEVPPDLYISHYPAVELDRSPDQFHRTLRATAENDVPGRFQPSYLEEAAGWCESTQRVRFHEYNGERLRAFWAGYAADTTYNLTNRNCSSTVVHALETALEGILGERGGRWFAFARVLLSPETWLAAELYRRAASMAWTPGLALDYARSLRGIIHPPPVAWFSLARMVVLRRRRRRHADSRQPGALDERPRTT